MSSESWSLIFSAVQTLAVVFAVGFGLHELRDLRHRRSWESLDKMLEEWRSHLGAHQEVLKRMPLHEGTVEERAVELAKLVIAVSRADSECSDRMLRTTLSSARDIVHGLNDIGAFVERGSVDQRDFFGHFHVRILELVFLLEPFVVLISACRGSRWGLRLRRLRIGAERYHYALHIHRSLTITVRGCTVLQGKEDEYAGRSPLRLPTLPLRRPLIPTKEECKREEDRLMKTVQQMLDAALADAGMTRAQFCENLPVDV